MVRHKQRAGGWILADHFLPLSISRTISGTLPRGRKASFPSYYSSSFLPLTLRAIDSLHQNGLIFHHLWLLSMTSFFLLLWADTHTHCTEDSRRRKLISPLARRRKFSSSTFTPQHHEHSFSFPVMIISFITFCPKVLFTSTSTTHASPGSIHTWE